jgi:hypothetical protein
MRWTSLLLCVAVSACSSNPGRQLGDGGGGGGADLSGGGGGDGGSGDQCPAEAKLVYLVDQNNKFSSFNPGTLAITDIGTLNCPAQVLATPFSMSVDRSAIAWVLYSSGELFKVDTTSLACTKTSFANPSGMVNFGMGFVSNSAGSTDETLFIAGGAAGAALGGGSSTFATLDFPGLGVTVKGTISGWPELTGTGDAKLWGFFPNLSPPKVAQIDKSSGADLVTLPLASLAGSPEAWAFAFWGGDFWIFLKRATDSSTQVHHVKPDGTLTTPLPSTNRTIVGAGVSTCAPITIN